tara:strand:- start:24 stop:224 length:201 start_codon:yes stop_codon:yes gene_type:complete
LTSHQKDSFLKIEGRVEKALKIDIAAKMQIIITASVVAAMLIVFLERLCVGNESHSYAQLDMSGDS